MIIDIQTNDEGGRWFPFFYSRVNVNTGEIEYDDPIIPENEEDGPAMKLRDPVPFFKERAEKRKTRTKYVLNSKSRAMDPVKEDIELTPEQRKAENDDFVDHVIQGIRNFKLNGKTVECTRQEKIDIMTKPVISLYVHRCIEILQSSGVKEEEVEKKISSSSSSSKMTKVAQQ